MPRDAPLVGSSSYFRLVRQSKTLNNLLDDYSESAYTNIESIDVEISTEHTFEGKTTVSLIQVIFFCTSVFALHNRRTKKQKG